VKTPKLSPHALEALAVMVVLGLVGGGLAIGWFIGWKTHEARNAVTVTAAAPAPAPPPATTAPPATTGAATTETAPEAVLTAEVAAGAHDFVQFGCFACHGELGQGGVSPDVPALTEAGKDLTVAQLTGIINHGAGEPSDPTKPYMPVWTGVVSKTQISNLVAYITAGLPQVPDATPLTVPEGQGDVVAGAALYQYYGCINCHGPNGLGGVPNPESEDKTIPPLAGSDFRAEFNTDQKIVDFIKTGSVLGKAPIVSMPHWGGIVPDPNLQALVAYLKTLAP
jgi:mono/diheme cytochrome c family protein